MEQPFLLRKKSRPIFSFGTAFLFGKKRKGVRGCQNGHGPACRSLFFNKEKACEKNWLQSSQTSPTEGIGRATASLLNLRRRLCSYQPDVTAAASRVRGFDSLPSLVASSNRRLRRWHSDQPAVAAFDSLPSLEKHF